jgi:hypothetical protein
VGDTIVVGDDEDAIILEPHPMEITCNTVEANSVVANSVTARHTLTMGEPFGWKIIIDDEDPRNLHFWYYPQNPPQIEALGMFLRDDGKFDFHFNGDIYCDNLFGDVAGNLTGNVTGDVTGDLTGNVTGNVTGTVTDPTRTGYPPAGYTPPTGASGTADSTIENITTGDLEANVPPGWGANCVIFGLRITTEHPYQRAKINQLFGVDTFNMSNDEADVILMEAINAYSEWEFQWDIKPYIGFTQCIHAMLPTSGGVGRVFYWLGAIPAEHFNATGAFPHQMSIQLHLDNQDGFAYHNDSYQAGGINWFPIFTTANTLHDNHPTYVVALNIEW